MCVPDPCCALTPQFSCKHTTTIAAKPHPKSACQLQRSLDGGAGKFYGHEGRPARKTSTLASNSRARCKFPLLAIRNFHRRNSKDVVADGNCLHGPPDRRAFVGECDVNRSYRGLIGHLRPLG
jgi:hypothetical protein